MIICKNKSSGKFFIVIEEEASDCIKVVTPSGRINTTQRSLFEDIIDGDENVFVETGIITESQCEAFNKYMEMEQEEALFITDISSYKQDSDHPPLKENITYRDHTPKHKEEHSMKKIHIDDEVYTFLQRKAIPFEETKPNDVLRRLLGLEKRYIPKRPLKKRTVIQNNKKAPKSDLMALVEIGFLNENQELTLSYKNETLSQEYRARIAGNRLIYEGELYTMSGLVAEILDIEEKGIPSRAYRGPDYWYTSDGISIRELWERYLLKT